MDDGLTDLLLELLKSHSHAISKSALELLSSPLVSLSSANDVADVLSRCLAAESVPLAVQGVRERVLRIGRISQGVGANSERGARICASWLLGMSSVFALVDAIRSLFSLRIKQMRFR